MVSRADLFGRFAEEHLGPGRRGPDVPPEAGEQKREGARRETCLYDRLLVSEREHDPLGDKAGEGALVHRGDRQGPRVRNEHRRRVEDLSGRPRARDCDDRVIPAAGGHFRGREGVALSEHLLVPVCGGRLGDVERGAAADKGDPGAWWKQRHSGRELSGAPPHLRLCRKLMLEVAHNERSFPGK